MSARRWAPQRRERLLRVYRVIRALVRDVPMRVIAADVGVSVSRVSQIAVQYGVARRRDAGKGRAA